MSTPKKLTLLDWECVFVLLSSHIRGAVLSLLGSSFAEPLHSAVLAVVKLLQHHGSELSDNHRSELQMRHGSALSDYCSELHQQTMSSELCAQRSSPL